MSYIQLGFKGGQANSVYDEIERGKFASARDLQIFNTIRTLKPNVALVNDAGIPANFVPRNVYLASDGKYYFLGTNSSSGNTELYSVTTLSPSSTYTAVSSIAGSSTSFPIEEFKDSLYWPKSADLKKYGNLSGAPAVSTSAASITTTVDFLKTHAGLGKLFYVHGTRQIIGYTSDGAAFTDAALTLEKNDRCVGIQPYGRFLFVGVVDVNAAKKARILVWDGSSTTYDDVIYLSEAGMEAFRIVNGYIEAIMLSGRHVRIYKFSPGGQPGRPAASYDIVSSGVTPNILDQALETDGDILYFGLSAVSDNLSTFDRDVGVFAFGNNTPGFADALNIDRLISTGSTTAGILCIKKFGNTLGAEVFVVITLTANSTFAINHTLNTTVGTYSANGVYESGAFALKKGLPGKIKRIIINHEAIPTSTGFTVSLKHLGHYPWGTSVPSAEAYSALTTNDGSGSSTGKTQSTNNAFITEIDKPDFFKTARFAQLKIAFDEILTTAAPTIVFPILVEVED